MSTILYITVEGVGTSDGLIRFASGTPDFDSDGLYVECLQGFPGEIGSEVDFRTGETTVAGLSVTLTRPEAAPWLYVQGAPSLGIVTAALTASATSMTTSVTDGSLASTMVCLASREVVAVGSHAGSGVYAITRAQLGTLAAAIDPATEGRDIYAAQGAPILADRVVTLGRVSRTAASYAAEEVLDVYVLSEISSPQRGAIDLQCDHILTWLRDLKIGLEIWRGSKPGGVASPAFTGPGTPYASSGDLAVCVEGKTALAELAYTTGGGSTVVSLAGAAVLDGSPALPDMAPIVECWEIIRGGTILTTSETVSTNAIELCLQLLTTTGSGANGAYDLGIADLGAGVPVSRVDLDAWADEIARVGAEADGDRQILFVDDEPPGILDLIRPRLRAYGLALAVDSQGRITVVGIRDHGTTAATLDASVIVPSSITQARQLTSPVDVIAVDWSLRPGLKPRRDGYTDARRLSRVQRGRRGKDTLDLTWLDDAGKVSRLAIRHVQRYRDPIPVIELYVARTVSVQMGDLVSVTSDGIYQYRAGALGVSGVVMQVVARRLDLSRGALKLRLLYTSARFLATGAIAPAARITAWSAGSRTLTVAAGAFASGDQPDYPRDVSGFAAGDILILCDRDHSIVEDALEIASVNAAANTITLTATPLATPTSGQLVKLDLHSTQGARGRALWAFMDGGSEVAVPYEWVG